MRPALRDINPQTRDYEIDSVTKQQAQMPGLRQRVLLAVTTVLASSTAVPSMGVALPKKMGTSYEAQVRNAVVMSLRQMIDVEKVLSCDAIIVKRTGSGPQPNHDPYTDLATGEQETVTARMADGDIVLPRSSTELRESFFRDIRLAAIPARVSRPSPRPSPELTGFCWVRASPGRS